jgi:hypothetical protein
MAKQYIKDSTGGHSQMAHKTSHKDEIFAMIIPHRRSKRKKRLSLIHILRSILIDVMGTGGHVRIGIPGQNNKTNKQTNKQTLIFLFVFLAISPIYTSGIPLVASLSLALQSGIFKKKSTLN